MFDTLLDKNDDGFYKCRHICKSVVRADGISVNAHYMRVEVRQIEIHSRDEYSRRYGFSQPIITQFCTESLFDYKIRSGKNRV